MSERRIRTGCVCGWEAVGPEDEVVEATIEHGRRVHNMSGTRDQVLAAAEDVTAGAGPVVEGSPAPER